MLHGIRTRAERNATWCIKTCTPRFQYVSEQWIVISGVCSSVHRIIRKSLSERLCSLNAYILFLLSKVCPLQHLHSVTYGRLNGMFTTFAQWEHSVFRKPKLKVFWFSQVSLTEERDRPRGTHGICNNDRTLRCASDRNVTSGTEPWEDLFSSSTVTRDSWLLILLQRCNVSRLALQKFISWVF